MKPKAKAEPAPTPTKPVQAPEKPVEKTPVTKSETQPLPGETPSTGTDVANIKIPGIEFPYPEYLRNIMNEVLRRWNAPNNRLRAEVAFLILKDGSVRDIRFLKRSGNFSFDLEAQGAIEAAGNGKAFGPLPDGWDANVLPVTLLLRAASVMPARARIRGGARRRRHARRGAGLGAAARWRPGRRCATTRATGRRS